MAGKTLQSTIKISGNLDPSLSKVINSVAKQMDKLEEAAKQAAGESVQLSAKITEQAKALKIAQMQYANYALKGEQSSDAAQELAQRIQKLSAELNQNRSALEQAEQAAEQLADGYDDAGNKSKNLGSAASSSSGGFTVMKGAISNLISSGIQWLIGKCSEAITSLLGLAEATQEYREDMGKLETAWESAGKSTDLATSTYKNFYSVLGEEDRSVEAVNHLAKFVDTEQDMQKWTDICTGVWGTFGDSLPVEGLTEASNETAKVGQVTGVLADALNWAGINEDKFNAQLAQCGSEQERAALITDTLNGLYSEAAGNYRENNESIIAARKATSDFTDAQAALGEKMEPLTTAFTNFKTKALTAITPYISKIISGLLQFGQQAMPVVIAVLNQVRPIISTIVSVIGRIASTIWNLLSAVLPPLITFIQTYVLPIINTVANVIRTVLNSALNAIAPIINGVKQVFNGLITFLQGVFTGSWSQVWNGVKQIFAGIFNSLAGIAKAPINAVIGIINSAIGAINKVSVDIPEWVPVVGGKHFGINIPTIPMLAQGGFTDGISIAGERGMEAVISFDPAYRKENLGYWSRAGQILGATSEDFSLSGNSSGSTTVNLGGVTFAPQISFADKTDKNSVIQAIKAEYPEFLDMLEEWLAERGVFAYG